jgi:hypothetical protein
MSNISNYERETIIRYDNEGKTATVYTSNSTLQRKLDRLCSERPDECRTTKQDEESKTYIVPQKWIKVNAPAKKREYTEEEKEIVRERFRVAKESRVKI